MYRKDYIYCTIRFSFSIPINKIKPAFINNFVQAIPAAPAPLHTILILPISFFEISSAFQSPARQMMAVPC